MISRNSSTPPASRKFFKMPRLPIASLACIDYVKQGRKVLQALHQTDFQVSEAFWYDFPESDEWRLVLASPKVDALGPLRACTVLDKVLRRIRSALTVGEISLFSPASSEYRELRRDALGPQSIGNGPATGRSQGGMAFRDAYLYNLPSPVRSR